MRWPIGSQDCTVVHLIKERHYYYLSDSRPGWADCGERMVYRRHLKAFRIRGGRGEKPLTHMISFVCIVHCDTQGQ
jgi:hypothetical protein